MEIGDKVTLREDSEWADYLPINPPSGVEGVITHINTEDEWGLEVEVMWYDEQYIKNSYPKSDLELI